MRCRIRQSAIERQLDEFGRIRRPDLLHHLEQCARCRAFVQRLNRLEQHLRTAPSGDIPDAVVDRMRDAVRQRLAEGPSHSAAQKRLPQHFSLRTGLSAAAAVLLVCGLSLLYFWNSRPAPVPDPAARFATGSAALQNRMSLWMSLPEQSIRTEWEKLTNDARSAARFINNCIPAAPAPGDVLDTDPNSR